VSDPIPHVAELFAQMVLFLIVFCTLVPQIDVAECLLVLFTYFEVTFFEAGKT
jgi:hypothetical protein